MKDPALAWWLLAAVALATYLWRLAGTLLSTRIKPGGALFRWVSCVSYALLAGLIARMVLLPAGALAEVALTHRLLALGAGFAVFFATGRGLLAGILAGFACFTALVAL